MDKERTKPDQKLCDTVKMMMAGKDAKVSQVVELLGISTATVNRIRKAGYSLAQFEKDKKDRNERKKELKEKRLIGKYFSKEAVEFIPPTGEQLAAALEPGAGLERALAAANQIEGQMEMDLRPAEEQKQGMDDQAKMMRFIAGQFSKVIEKLDKLNDTMSQILRRTDK